MSDEKSAPQETQPKKKLTREEKQAAHVQRITRTTVACVAGLLSGVLSFLLAGTPDAAGIQSGASTGILLLAAAIAVQKYLFPLLKADTPSLTMKDWFFQGFMTFSLWFISWTVLLSAGVPA
ncbi:MAG: hypothetical protein LUO87_04510 [Methanomicrobiales archaeon]|nr:hypothetical protein [Methanomicrobiales archaeon]MDD1657794.1 hypothetical protein [Methanomicrobiales archaeon]